MITDKIKFFFKNISNNPYWFLKVYYTRFIHKLKRQEIPPIKLNYLNPEETINYLVNNPSKSIARIGDGEIAVFLGGDIYFQNYSQFYKNEFLRMLLDENKDLLIGIPAYEVSNTATNLRENKYDPSYWDSAKVLFDRVLNKKKVYGSYNISSFFRNNYCLISRLWKGKDVIIVGGVTKYFKTKKLQYAKDQILVETVEKNALDDFDSIFKTVRTVYENLNSKNCVVLIGCGPCATILAYWLSKHKIVAYDLGHFFDINEGVW